MTRLTLALLLLTGCDGYASSGWADPAAGLGHDLSVGEALIEGTGPEVVVDPADPQWVAGSWWGHEGGSVDVRGGHDGQGVLMNLLTLNVDPSTLQPGERLVVDGEPEPGVVPEVELLGCAGDRDDAWHWDRHAHDLEVRVQEGPEPHSLTLRWRASFLDPVPDVDGHPIHEGTTEGVAVIGLPPGL